METVTVSKNEYEILKAKARLNESLLVKLVKGLEDVRQGRIKPWQRTTKH